MTSCHTPDRHIRCARSTDAGRVGAILSEFIDTTPWMPRIHSRAQDLGFAGMMIERGWVSVVEQNERVVGFIALDGPRVQALYVGAEARGRGHGAALLQGAQAALDALELWTFQANNCAQAFYRRHGFSEVERTDGARNDEHLPDIRFLWERAV